MPKTKLISSMLSVCMSVNLLSSSMIQSTYIVSNAISLNDMDFTIPQLCGDGAAVLGIAPKLCNSVQRAVVAGSHRNRRYLRHCTDYRMLRCSEDSEEKCN